VKYVIQYAKMTGIEVNSEAYFQKLREYFPSAEGTHAGNIPATEGNQPHYWSMMTVTICFVIPVIEMEDGINLIICVILH